MEDYDKLCNMQAEMEVLAGCFGNVSEFYRICELLTEDCFTDAENKRIWRVMQRLKSEGKDVCRLSVMRETQADKGAFNRVMDIGGNYVSMSTHGAEAVLLDLEQRRKALAAMAEARAKLFDLLTPCDETATALSDALTKGMTGASEAIAARDAMQLVMNNCFANLSEREVEIPTGFEWLDGKGGLHAEDLTIVAGETSMGKTSFAVTMAVNAALSGVPSVIVTLEMPVLQVAARIVSSKAKIPGSAILYKKLATDEYNIVGNAAKDYSGIPLWFDGDSLTLPKIMGSIRRLHSQKGAKLFVIDYLQLIADNGREGTKEQRLADTARALKNLAKELKVCIVLLSQLSRTKDGNPYPTLSRLRGSGQISEAADSILFVYRPEYYKTEGKNLPHNGAFKNISTAGTAEIILAKGRNIGVGSFIAGFDANCTTFYDTSPLLLPQAGYAAKSDEPPF